MALALALPLFGLDPEHFTTLSMKLLNIEREQNLKNFPGSGRDSPSTGSESSGVSSLAMSGESALTELTPVPSRPETPIRVPCKSQEKTNELLHTIYGGRDILNLGANIRSSYDWQIRAKRSIHYRPYNRESLTDYPVRRCSECGFCEPLPRF